MESIGGVVNFWPACCMCGIDCCCCFFIVLVGWVNIIGSSVPACCKKDCCGFGTMAVTSFTALLGRIIMVAVFSIWVHRLNTGLEDYDKCMKKCDEATDDATYLFGDDEYYCDLECDDELGFTTSRDVDEFFIFHLTIALVMAGIWTIVAIIGAVCGLKGCLAEKKAEAGVKAGAAVVIDATPVATSAVVAQPAP